MGICRPLECKGRIHVHRPRKQQNVDDLRTCKNGCWNSARWGVLLWPRIPQRSNLQDRLELPLRTSLNEEWADGSTRRQASTWDMSIGGLFRAVREAASELAPALRTPAEAPLIGGPGASTTPAMLPS